MKLMAATIWISWIAVVGVLIGAALWLHNNLAAVR